LLGLLSVTGTSSAVYTSATPTGAENFAQLGRLVSATASAYGAAIDTILLHPRRAAYVRTMLGYAPEWPAGVVEVGAIPTNLGAGTNEDIVIALARAESPLFVQPPSFRALIDPLSANLEVVSRCTDTQRCWRTVSRQASGSFLEPASSPRRSRP